MSVKSIIKIIYMFVEIFLCSLVQDCRFFVQRLKILKIVDFFEIKYSLCVKAKRKFVQNAEIINKK